MEGKKEALRREASESSSTDSTLRERLAELESLKPQPYGTLHAVSLLASSTSFHVLSLTFTKA